MNKDSFWAGVGMLVAPIILYLSVIFIKSLSDIGISWTSFIFWIIIIVYVIVAIYLIIRGLNESSKK